MGGFMPATDPPGICGILPLFQTFTHERTVLIGVGGRAPPFSTAGRDISHRTCSIDVPLARMSHDCRGFGGLRSNRAGAAPAASRPDYFLSSGGGIADVRNPFSGEGIFAFFAWSERVRAGYHRAHRIGVRGAFSRVARRSPVPILRGNRMAPPRPANWNGASPESILRGNRMVSPRPANWNGASRSAGRYR